METLGQSLALAAPGKFIRNYLDLGPQMHELLLQFCKQKNLAVMHDEAYVAQLLDAYPNPPETKRVSPVFVADDLLTTRELEVLKFLATDLSTKEIAAEVNVTWSTVRTHIKNIYAKLEVHGRYEAVQRAKELELL